MTAPDLFRIDLDDLRAQAEAWRTAVAELPGRAPSDKALLRRLEGAFIGTVATVQVLSQ